MGYQELGRVRWFGGRGLGRGAGHAVGVEEVHEFGFGEMEAQRAQGDAEFVVVEMAVAIEVEE